MKLQSPAPPSIEVYPELPPVARQLWNARQCIVQYGWIQHRSEDPDTGAVCAYGAWVQSNSGLSWAGWHLLCRVSPISGSPITYNDLPTTTEADILALFDKAVELAIKKGV